MQNGQPANLVWQSNFSFGGQTTKNETTV